MGLMFQRLPGIHKATFMREAEALVEKCKETMDNNGWGTWPRLAEATEEDRIRQGYEEWPALVRSEALRDALDVVYPEAGAHVNVAHVGWFDEPHPDSKIPLSMAQIGGIHEFGNARARVPERSVLRLTFAREGEAIAARATLAMMLGISKFDVRFTPKTRKSRIVYNASPGSTTSFFAPRFPRG